MPTLPIARVPSIPQLDNLAPRDAHLASLVARQPALDNAADKSAGFNAPAQAFVEKRQTQQIQQPQPGLIPTYYKIDGPPSGTVVGIVLGSVVGFLLLLGLIYSLAKGGGIGGGGANIAGEEEIVVRRPRRNSHSGRSRRSTRTEVREYSRSPRRREAPVIVEERRGPRTTRTRSIVVEERARVPGDDVVEVIEEHDEYRSRRGGRRY